jgi:hypothetical protein
VARDSDFDHAHTHSCLQTSQRFVLGPSFVIMSIPHSGHSNAECFSGFSTSSVLLFTEVDFALFVFLLEDWR